MGYKCRSCGENFVSGAALGGHTTRRHLRIDDGAKTIDREDVKINIVANCIVTVSGSLSFGLGIGAGDWKLAGIGMVAMVMGLGQIGQWIKWSRK